jgi:hypothetical protein
MEIPYKGDSIKDCPIITWELGADGVGGAFECHNVKILSVAFEGSGDVMFRGGAEACLEGAIGEKFHILTTPDGSFVSSRMDAMKSVSGRCIKVRPRILGGSDETNIKVILFGRKLR